MSAAHLRRRSARRTAVLATIATLTVAAGVTVPLMAHADAGWYDESALETSCVEPVDGLGRANRCRFEPSSLENFTGSIQRVSGDTLNCNTIAATKTISWAQTTGEEDSVQVSVTAKVTLIKDVFDVSITTTYGHSWSHSTTETNTESAPVPALSVAWIERGAAMQRVTGRMVINYAKRRHGHFEWYTYPTLTSADPSALGYQRIILRSRPMTEAEKATYC